MRLMSSGSSWSLNTECEDAASPRASPGLERHSSSFLTVIPMDCYQKTTCRLCESTELSNVLSLTATPPGNHFVLAKDSHREQPRYPLGLNFCVARLNSYHFTTG